MAFAGLKSAIATEDTADAPLGDAGYSSEATSHRSSFHRPTSISSSAPSDLPSAEGRRGRSLRLREE
jgi:hypothetical protein